MQSVAQKIKALATVKNAMEYDKTQDKYIFAECLIESELHIFANTRRVEYLEKCFDEVIAAERNKAMVQEQVVQNMDQNKAYAYIFSPLTGQRLTLGYCLKLMDKYRDGSMTRHEELDMKLAVAWHDALNESMKGE
jgi:hypothetical protein